MKLNVNGKDFLSGEISLTVVQLLKEVNVENPDMVSVQLNGEFVSKDRYAVMVLKDGDTVDFLYFMGGGRV